MYGILYVAEGCGRPSLKQLNNHVTEAVAVKWRDLGYQLLNSDSAQDTLDIIEANHKQVNLAVSNIMECYVNMVLSTDRML